MTCNVSGDIQSIAWERRGADNIIHSMNSESTRNVSSYWIATIKKFLLNEKFPFTFTCVPIGKCCSKRLSDPKIVRLPTRSNDYAYERCFKDILIIVDMSGSIRRSDIDSKFKPFLRRLVDDPRSRVSEKGCNIAIMSFGEEATIRLPFSRHYNKSVYYEVIHNMSSWSLPGARTKTFLALQQASEEIFNNSSPLNHRPNVDDVIVLITDGLPTTHPRRYTYNDTVSLAGSLKQKGVRIVGISYSGYPRSFKKLTNFIKDLSTPGEALETTLDDITMIVDRVVDGFCPQPLLIPSKPQNVAVTILSGYSMEVSWLPPRVSGSNIDYYIISWRRNDRNSTFYQKNATSSPFRIRNIDNLASYTIKIAGVNHVGIGEAVNLSNVLIPAIRPTTTKVIHTIQGEKSEKTTVIVAGGVTGSLLFLILVLVAFLYLRRRIWNKRREESIKEFQLFHKSNATTSMRSVLPPPDPSNNRSELETEEIAYVVLLKDWEISPSQLKVQDRALGAGQFGIVKQGVYTVSEKSDPQIVAVKMLKDNARESDHSDLLAELEILKKINNEPHPNVIRFIGGCSMEGKLLVVTEFCPGGSLLKYLRRSRISSNQEESRPKYLNVTSTLNHRQLLQLAADVANGMVHLSAQKFVHRDLAARNILLGNENVAKISDFGLARDIESVEEYVRTTQNLLPVKWMAVESLLYGRFTTASDVWSFGVLLYEIATLDTK